MLFLSEETFLLQVSHRLPQQCTTMFTVPVVPCTSCSNLLYTNDAQLKMLFLSEEMFLLQVSHRLPQQCTTEMFTVPVEPYTSCSNLLYTNGAQLYVFCTEEFSSVLLHARNQYIKLLTFKSLAVSLRTTRFNIQNFYMVLALR
jgi:hypothetical protein